MLRISEERFDRPGCVGANRGCLYANSWDHPTRSIKAIASRQYRGFSPDSPLIGYALSLTISLVILVQELKTAAGPRSDQNSKGNRADAQLLMIGGTGRSGTTVLKRIFANHPAVLAAPESRYMVDPDGIVEFFLGCTAGWSPYSYNMKVSRLTSVLEDVARGGKLAPKSARLLRRMLGPVLLPRKMTPRYAGLDLTEVYPGFASYARELIADLTSYEFTAEWVGGGFLQRNRQAYHEPFARAQLAERLGGFVRSVVESGLRHRGLGFHLDDNTWNMLWFDTILEILPESRLVHVYRDPRDVVTSFTRQPWAPDDARQAALFYRGIMERWRVVRSRLPAGSFIEISLEGLVRNPRETLSRVCYFWGLPWDDALLDIDLSRSNNGRWQRDLSFRQQSEVNSIVASFVDELGYGS